AHGDHTGGNEGMGKEGATILARGSLRNRLMRPAPAANGQATPATPAPGLPVITYSANSQLAFHMNGEDIQLIPIPNAHTDGDTMVRFVQNDVIMTGDFFRSVQYPNLDRGNGGSLNGMICPSPLIIPFRLPPLPRSMFRYWTERKTSPVRPPSFGTTRTMTSPSACALG